MKALLLRLFGKKPHRCGRCRQALAELDLRFQTAASAQSVLSIRIARFKQDHPDLWQKYFSAKAPK